VAVSRKHYLGGLRSIYVTKLFDVK